MTACEFFYEANHASIVFANGKGGCAPPNPPAVLRRMQACLTASVSYLQLATRNMSLIETTPFTMRAVCLQTGGWGACAPPTPCLRKLA